MHPDNEINALNDVYESLRGLDHAQIKRILVWVKDKFALDKQADLKAVEREVEAETPKEPAQPPAAVAEAVVEPVKKRRGRKPGKAKTIEKPLKKRRGRPAARTKPVVDEPVLQLAESPVIQGFLEYENFEELFLFSKANTNTAKILLAASYLQVKKNLKEFGSNDISSLFKEIGEEMSQTSPFLSNLMSKKPPLLVQTGTEGPGLKARRKFRVTEEGLRIAGNYIKE